ncbi:MAG: DUF2188 domain-containing protein [Planctomycetaceae bacterium]|jgi:uncharacterized protein YdaT|nr:DUF2188 domain-containing protein [Planctomycetaceae bacterium]
MTKNPKNTHVVPHPSGWAVKQDGAQRASSLYDTQKEAIQEVRQISRQLGTELKIHGKDGRIRESDSHGNDPCPPKG